MKSLRIGSGLALALAAASPLLAEAPHLPAGLNIPARGADGTFQTINSGIGPMKTIWHVRAALNVAALSCRESSQASLIGGYNTLIARQKATFKKADAAIQSLYQKQYAATGRTEHDLYMTRLYNFFSQPLAKTAFCDASVGVMADALAVPAGGFEAFAPGGLARLQAPILAVYAGYDEYERAYAAWQQQNAPAAPAVESAAATEATATPAAAAVQLADVGALGTSGPPATMAAPAPADAASATPVLGYAAIVVAGAAVASPIR